MSVAVPPLVEGLRALPEVRTRRGIRHPQVARLTLACAAMFCGRTRGRAAGG